MTIAKNILLYIDSIPIFKEKILFIEPWNFVMFNTNIKIKVLQKMVDKL